MRSEHKKFRSEMFMHGQKRDGNNILYTLLCVMHRGNEYMMEATTTTTRNEVKKKKTAHTKWTSEQWVRATIQEHIRWWWYVCVLLYIYMVICTIWSRISRHQNENKFKWKLNAGMRWNGATVSTIRLRLILANKRATATRWYRGKIIRKRKKKKHEFIYVYAQ